MTQTARQLAIASENRSIDASTARATEAARPRSALESLASRLNVSPKSLQNTLMQTSFKGCSETEFVAMVIVSNTYELNPLLREIYAFPKKGGGIQAIVGYDGWIKIANSHPQFDGIEFLHIEDDANNLKAIEGVLYRKDRSHPTKKIVYLKEFKRNTDPWNNSPHHMLDVRCFCHTVRLGLGVSLGVEGDEGLDVDGGIVQSVTLPRAEELADQREPEQHDAETGEVLATDPQTGMTEVSEEEARELDAATEGRSDEDMGEAHTETQAEAAAQTVQDIDGPLEQDSDTPPWQVAVDKAIAGANAAKTVAEVEAVDKEWSNHRGVIDDDSVTSRVDSLINAARKELKAAKA